jgi:myo-inositol-1(or 4)-monophosphatase
MPRRGRACSVSRTARLEDGLFGSGPPFRRKQTAELDRISHGIRRSGAAALELALVADGGLDGFWDRGLKAWDLAAASLCVIEAGGRVSDLTGRPISVDVQAGIVATNDLLHAPLREALGL